MAKQPLFFGVLGVISGILAYVFASLALNNGDPSLESVGIQFAPGLLFGIAILAAAFLILKKTISFFHASAWLLASTGSYYVAVQVALQLIGQGGDATPQAFVGAGFVGSLLMLLGYYVTIQELSAASYTSLALLGGVLGLAYVIGKNFTQLNNPELLTLLIVWQAGMAIGLGIVSSNQHRI